MNRALRVLIVSRHFWPHGSVDSAGCTIDLATALHRRGVHVEVLTPKFSNRWVERLTFREMTVHRPIVVPKNEWAVNRYVRQMTQWIQNHGDSFDLVFSQGARDEAVAVVDASRRLGIPSIVRVGGYGTASDSHWWQTGRWPRRCLGAAKSADCILTSHTAQHRQLITDGFDESKIERMSIAISGLPSKSAKEKERARFALAAINSDLFASPESVVALAVSPMTRSFGSSFLVRSAMSLISRMPNLKLWLIGDGPGREATHRSFKSDGIRQSIAIPGSFSNMEDVFTAADLYVQADDHGMDCHLPTAISAGLPLVIRDSPLTRALLDPAGDASLGPEPPSESCVAWFDEQITHKSDSRSLRSAFESILANPDQAIENAEKLRQRMQRQMSRNESLECYVSLFRRLADSNKGQLRSTATPSQSQGLQRRSRSESGS